MMRIGKNFIKAGFGLLIALLSSVQGFCIESADLEINENSKITKIEFEGVHLVPVSFLINAMEAKSGDTYSTDLVQKSLQSIYQTGYFKDNMQAVPIQSSPETVTLKIFLEENIPVTGFTISGNTVVNSGEILSILEPLEGQPQNINAVNEAAARIEELYASKGYILARVSETSEDPDGCVNFYVKEGTINSISFQGNQKTKNFVIERNILSVPGGVYNENMLKADLSRLYATQAFKDVNRTIQPSADNPDAYDIVIELEEQRTGQISIGGGLDTASGLFGQAGFVENNFLGNGQRVGINFTAGTGVIMSDNSTLDHANLQAEVSFFEPRLRGSDNSLLLRAYARDFGSYQVPLAIEQRFGAEAVISRPIKSYQNLTGSFKLGAEYIKVKEGDDSQINALYNLHKIPIEERAKQLQGGAYLTLGPALTYDTRDSSLYPRNGVLASVSLSENINLSDFSYTYGTLSGGIKRYFPLMTKSSFSISARAGGKFHGKMPEVSAYSLGGPYTVRGFRLGSIGTGTGYMIGSAEITTPFFFLDRIKKAEFFDNIKFSMFIDAGKVFNGTITNKMYDRPRSGIAAGVGIKIYIPGMGPLSIDYGIPLTRTSGSRKGVFSFGYGDSF